MVFCIQCPKKSSKLKKKIDENLTKGFIKTSSFSTTVPVLFIKNQEFFSVYT